MSSGWTDLAIKFADIGMPVPPIPEGKRRALKKMQPDAWCWSTRPDISSDEMYDFDSYVTEIFQGETKDYTAFCHSGHGIGSWGLTFQLVHGPIAFALQNLWGAPYNPRTNDRNVFETYAMARGILTSRPEDMKGRTLKYFIVGSDFHYLRHWESEERHWLRLYQPLTKRELLEMEDSTDSLADPQKLWTYTSFATPLDLLEYWEKEVCDGSELELIE